MTTKHYNTLKEETKLGHCTFFKQTEACDMNSWNFSVNGKCVLNDATNGQVMAG